MWLRSNLRFKYKYFSWYYFLSISWVLKKKYKEAHKHRLFSVTNWSGVWQFVTGSATHKHIHIHTIFCVTSHDCERFSVLHRGKDYNTHKLPLWTYAEINDKRFRKKHVYAYNNCHIPYHAHGTVCNISISLFLFQRASRLEFAFSWRKHIQYKRIHENIREKCWYK